jgi:hypothetical protein
MATTLNNPDARSIQPDPILTNVVQDNSANGDWFAPVIVSIRQVARDFVRWGKQDSQSLLSNFFETLRTPGGRYNLLPRPVLAWLTSVVQEDAVRVEYTEEDVRNSISPLDPAMNSAMKVLNVLQFASEVRAQALMHAATNTDGADASWSGTAGSIQSDIEAAKLAVLKASGMPANGIMIPPSKIPGVMASTEIKNLRVFTDPSLLTTSGLPRTLFGLRPFSPGTRIDTVPTGTFTPAFVWDTNLEAFVFYSPTLDGGYWAGDGQAYGMQFENQLNGSAFEVRSRLDPNYEENLIHIVYGNVRRSAPEIFNEACGFRITGI